MILLMQIWLFNELARGQKESRSHDELTDTSSQIVDSFTDMSNILEEGDEVETVSSRTNQQLNPISHLMTPKTKELLLQIHNYHFPIFDFAEATLNRPLIVMSYQLFIQSGLLSRLNLPIGKFLNFMIAIESGYRSNLTCTHFSNFSSQLYSCGRCFAWYSSFDSTGKNSRIIF